MGSRACFVAVRSKARPEGHYNSSRAGLDVGGDLLEIYSCKRWSAGSEEGDCGLRGSAAEFCGGGFRK